ncbi:MAG: thioredoxin domain-containing protein [Lachnospirales bacterium]
MKKIISTLALGTILALGAVNVYADAEVTVKDSVGKTEKDFSEEKFILDAGGSNLSTSNIKTYDQIGNFSLTFGKEDAPYKMTEYISFQCSYCKDFFLESHEYLTKEIEDGNIYLELKFIDLGKFKYDDFIFERIDNLNDLKTIYKVFNTYDQWTKMESFEEVSDFFQLGDSNLERYIDLIINKTEMKILGLNEVPSVVINDEIPEETVETLDTLKAFIKTVDPIETEETE